MLSIATILNTCPCSSYYNIECHYTSDCGGDAADMCINKQW